jgi:hypothetical protein
MTSEAQGHPPAQAALVLRRQWFAARRGLGSGRVVGVYSDWTPLAGRGQLFDEDLDNDDPWQFKNSRVV